jgi:hypothetical protein
MSDRFDKVIAGVLGAAMVVGFGWLGVDSVRDYRRFGNDPLETDALGAVEASASGRQWVQVGAPWRCDQLILGIDGGVAFLPAFAADGSLIVARFDHDIRCEPSRPLTGIIEPMDAKRAADLRATGLTWTEGAALRTLGVCHDCGKDNARLGILVCSCFVLAGIFLYPLMGAIRSAIGRFQGGLQVAIHAPAERADAANRSVRLRGALLLAAGIAGVLFGEGWSLWHFLPLRWAAIFPLLLGGWMAASPASYRRVSAKAPRR